MLKEYFDKHSQIITENYNFFFRENNAEAIHNFRLSLKRMKVVMQFVEILSNGKVNTVEQIKKFRPLFKRTGRIRDIHVQVELFITLIETLKLSDKAYLDYLQDTENKQYRKLTDSLSDEDLTFLDDFRDIMNATTNGMSRDYIFSKGVELIEKKYNRIKEIYHSSSDENRFHAIRGLLKDIYYIGNILDMEPDLEKIINITHERLNELGSLFGSWHDKVNAIKFIKRFLKNNPEKIDAYSELIEFTDAKRQEEFYELDRILIEEISIG